MTAYFNPPRYSFALIEGPMVEPLTLEEAMDHLNIDLDDRHNDRWLNRNIKTAREYCEGYRGQTLAPQTLEIGYGGQSPATMIPDYWQTPALSPWPTDNYYIELPYGPAREIESIIYVDGAGDEQTMDPLNYTLAGDKLLLASGSTWPILANQHAALRIRYVAGYSLPEDELPYPLPQALHSAMLLALGDLFDKRENSAAGNFNSVPLGAHALMDLCPGKRRLGNGMNAGQFDKIVDLERREIAEGGTGDPVVTWVPVAKNLPANIRWVSGREYLAGLVVASQVVAFICIRWRGDVDATMRIKRHIHGRTTPRLHELYNIAAVWAVEDDGAPYLKLPVTLGVNDG